MRQALPPTSPQLVPQHSLVLTVPTVQMQKLRGRQEGEWACPGRALGLSGKPMSV